MLVTDLSTIRIQVPIQSETRIGSFHDAITFSPAEFEALNEKELAVQVQARVDNWISSVENAPDPEPPRVEDLMKQAARLQEDLNVLAAVLGSADFKNAPELDEVRLKVQAAVDGLEIEKP